jgi:hypothetical protein
MVSQNHLSDRRSLLYVARDSLDEWSFWTKNPYLPTFLPPFTVDPARSLYDRVQPRKSPIPNWEIDIDPSFKDLRRNYSTDKPLLQSLSYLQQRLLAVYRTHQRRQMKIALSTQPPIETGCMPTGVDNTQNLKVRTQSFKEHFIREFPYVFDSDTTIKGKKCGWIRSKFSEFDLGIKKFL